MCFRKVTAFSVLFQCSLLVFSEPNYKHDVYLEFFRLNDIKNSVRTHFEQAKVGAQELPGATDLEKGTLRVQMPKDLIDVFDADKPTFMYIHGFYSTQQTQMNHVHDFVESMGTDCCNFVVLSWTKIALNLYYWNVRLRARVVSAVQ